MLIDEALADIDARCLEARATGAELGLPYLVGLRHRVRERLLWLKSQLAEIATEHDIYFVLLPLVIHIDERILIISHGSAARWEPLQSELYDIENGGELFYSTLEDRLRRAETSGIVFEVFHYCLSDGFQGMHLGEPRKVEEYKARLAGRIQKPPVRSCEEIQARAVQLVRSPLRYYAAAAGVVLCTYLVLSLF